MTQVKFLKSSSDTANLVLASETRCPQQETRNRGSSILNSVAVKATFTLFAPPS